MKYPQYIALTAVMVMLGGAGCSLPQKKDVISIEKTETGIVETKENERATPHPISIPALAEKQFAGRDFTVGKVLAENESYTRYYITYKSGELTISGIMNVPKGTGPFPVLILNHGYIDPAVYTNGRGLRREQDYLVRQGYVVIHPDYRNHAGSDKDPEYELSLRLGYVEDVINVVLAIKQSGLPYIDPEHIGMLGHSMGGGVTLNVLVTKPDLIKAAVLFAPVSGDMVKNFDRWLSRRPETAEKIVAAYGAPENNGEFWHNVSALNFVEKIQTPILIHHGTTDESVPIEWSSELANKLEANGKQYEYKVYPNEPHEFAKAWPKVMERTADFFNEYLK